LVTKPADCTAGTALAYEDIFPAGAYANLQYCQDFTLAPAATDATIKGYVI
jgi:hypothetical protein